MLPTAEAAGSAGPARVLCTATLVPHRDPLPAEDVFALADAAASAGCDGVTLWSAHSDWVVAAGFGPTALVEHHGSKCLSIPLVEVVTDWVGLDSSGIAVANAGVLDLAERAGAWSIVAVALDRDESSHAVLRRSLADLCDVAADRGLRVSVEFIPRSGIPDLATALRLVADADRDNLGIVLDVWHWHHQAAGADLDQISAVPPDRLDVIQLNDAPAQPVADPRVTGLTERLVPGGGDVDIAGLLDAVDALGADPIVASEVFSGDLARCGPAAMATAVVSATDAVVGTRSAWGRGGRRGQLGHGH